MALTDDDEGVIHAHSDGADLLLWKRDLTGSQRGTGMALINRKLDAAQVSTAMRHVDATTDLVDFVATSGEDLVVIGQSEAEISPGLDTDDVFQAWDETWSLGYKNEIPSGVNENQGLPTIVLNDTELSL
jgi:hypothetical protein